MAVNRLSKPTHEEFKALSFLKSMDLPVAEGESNYRQMDVNVLDHYSNHPFHIYNDQRMHDLVESIKTYGVLTPILVRKSKTPERYEVLAGHNRLEAAKKADLTEVPVIIIEGLTEDEATMVVIETNALQRSFSDLTYSERAKAISMQYSIMKKNRYRRDIVDSVVSLERGEEEVQAFDSGSETANIYSMARSSIYLYVRIATLGDKGLELLDNGKIALAAGVEISFIEKEKQQLIYECVEDTGYGINKEKGIALRKEAEKGNGFSREMILQILDGTYFEKPKKRSSSISIPAKTWTKYFPEGTDSKTVNKVVDTLLCGWSQKWKQYFPNDATDEEMVNTITRLLDKHLKEK